jgi:FkbM family methyltransferase
LTLHAYRHRGYWFHGRHREEREMNLARQLLPADGLILDVGANVGFLTLVYRSHSPGAHVVAVEPSPANLRYLRCNLGRVGVDLAELAVGAEPGEATLYEDQLTGQNSSLVEGFEVLAKNAATAHTDASTVAVSVPVTTIDDLVDERGLPLRFLKVDVEGFELEALRGARRHLVSDRPALQIEVQRNIADVLALLAAHSFTLYARTAWPLNELDGPQVVFALPSERSQTAFARAARELGYVETHSDPPLTNG